MTAETLGDIMSRPVIGVPADAPLLTALRQMVRHDTGSVLTETERGVTGIVTERDIVKSLAGNDPGVLLRSLAEVIPARRLVTAPPDASPMDAFELMATHRIRRIPVAAEGRVVGIVTERDLIRWVLDHPEVILDMLSATTPAVARDALVALVREMQLRPQV